MLDYGCIACGLSRKSYLQTMDPVHKQGLGLFITHVESLYVDAHQSHLLARRAKLSLQYASKNKSLRGV